MCDMCVGKEGGGRRGRGRVREGGRKGRNIVGIQTSFVLKKFNKTAEFLPTKDLASPTCDLLHT